MSILSLLNQSATIERSTPARAATGEVSASWAAVATGVSCRLEAGPTQAQLRDVGFSLTADAMAMFPSGTDVQPQTTNGLGDRVLIDGVRYLVLGVRPLAGTEKVLAAALQRQA